MRIARSSSCMTDPARVRAPRRAGAGSAVGLQRSGVLSGPVQRQHELAEQPLAERLSPKGLLELPDQFAGAAACELGFDPLLDRCQTAFL